LPIHVQPYSHDASHERLSKRRNSQASVWLKSTCSCEWIKVEFFIFYFLKKLNISVHGSTYLLTLLFLYFISNFSILLFLNVWIAIPLFFLFTYLSCSRQISELRYFIFLLFFVLNYLVLDKYQSAVEWFLSCLLERKKKLLKFLLLFFFPQN
jgi:hypothetical protein